MTNDDVQAAASHLQQGGVVAFPTETVYGLGANALDAVAVAKVFELKARPRFDPLIVHIASAARLSELVEAAPRAVGELIQRFWPGPLTLVLAKRPVVPDIVTAGLPTVAVRMPDHPVALELIRAAGVPIAAPSANRFGMVSPTSAAHVREQFGESLPVILDGGPCRVGVESTVLSLAGDVPELLRPGGLSREEIEEVVGTVRIAASDDQRPQAPGQLSRHYATTTPLTLCASIPAAPPGQRVGLLSLQSPERAADFAAVEVLSASGDMREAAANLFAALRRLDALGLDRIVALPVPERGLGLAIMDRLRRAAAERET